MIWHSMINLVERREFRRSIVTAIWLSAVFLAMGLIGSAYAAFEGPAPTPTPTPTPVPVGGEVVGVDVISVFLSSYWLLILILAIPLAFALYKKRSAIPKWLLR